MISFHGIYSSFQHKLVPLFLSFSTVTFEPLEPSDVHKKTAHIPLLSPVVLGFCCSALLYKGACSGAVG